MQRTLISTQQYSFQENSFQLTDAHVERKASHYAWNNTIGSSHRIVSQELTMISSSTQPQILLSNLSTSLWSAEIKWFSILCLSFCFPTTFSFMLCSLLARLDVCPWCDSQFHSPQRRSTVSSTKTNQTPIRGRREYTVGVRQCRFPDYAAAKRVGASSITSNWR